MDEWTEEELIIAMEFYYSCPERMHTDSHQKCQEIAHMLGRTPGALDAIIRNIKFVDTGGTGYGHASRRIHKLVHRYQGDQAALRSRARSIRQNNGWPPLNCGD